MWWEYEQTGFDITNVSGRMRFTRKASGFARADYQIGIDSGDFDLRLDIPNYPSINDSSFFVQLFVKQAHNDYTNRIGARRYYSGGTHYNRAVATINGVGQTAVTVSGNSFAVRITRVGTVLSVYFKSGATWTFITSYDFGVHASNLTTIEILCNGGSAPNGSYIEVDNLKFAAGCPSGTILWTTTSTSTSSSTSSSTTTTEAP